jgi:tRNA(fMet)-specific endonuclease VapC
VETVGSGGGGVKCLDSDFLIAILRGDKSVERKMVEIDADGKASTVSVNAFEILYGAHHSAKKEKNLKEAKRLLNSLDILALDYKAAEKASEIQSNLIEVGEGIGLKDVFIAAAAITNRCTLVTKNTKHFSKIGTLKLESW